MADFARKMALLDRQAKALLARLEDRAPDTKAAPFGRRMADETSAIAQVFGRIEADGDLSEQGKAVRGRRLAAERIDGLRVPSSELRRFAGAAERELQQFGTPRLAAPGVEAAMLRAEVRQWLRGLPPAERTKVILTAGDEILAAVAEAPHPGLVGLKSAAERDKLLADAARTARPQELARLESEVEGGQIARQLDQTAWQSLAVLARLDEPEAQAFASGETGYCLPEPRPQRAAA